MTIAFDERARQVVPRWRPSRWSESARGLAPLVQTSTDLEVSRPGEWFRAVESWRRSSSISTASELIGTAVVLAKNNDPDAKSAAQFIAQLGNEVNDAVRSFATTFLSGTLNRVEPAAGSANEEIRKLRARTIADPRDALAWIDLAFWQVTTGHSAGAQRAILAATSQSRHRFIVRSAARYFLHIGDPDQALAVLRRGTARNDPWILAADIALSGDAKSNTIKNGFKLLGSGGVAEADATELAVALATQELGAGDRRSAKKLAQLALRYPTENTVAQMVWLNRQDSRLLFNLESYSHLNPSEALTRNATSRGAFNEALGNAWKWLRDQPFSTQPAASGSFAAASGANDYDGALKILDAGLVANPTDTLLLNNKAFALAAMGRVDEAKVVMASIGPLFDVTRRAVVVATRGLIAYREGRFDEGRQLYEDACRALTEPNILARATLLHAREAFLAGSPWAIQLFRKGEAAMNAGTPADVKALHEQLEKKFVVPSEVKPHRKV